MSFLDRFIGSHVVSIDPKGRLYLPARFRKLLEARDQSALIVTISSSRKLVGYPVDEWVAKYDALASGADGLTEERERKLRLVSSYAEEAPVKNGKVLISARLREFGQLDRAATVVGMSRKIEIFAPERFAELTGGKSDDEIAAELAGLGF